MSLAEIVAFPQHGDHDLPEMVEDGRNFSGRPYEFALTMPTETKWQTSRGRSGDEGSNHTSSSRVEHPPPPPAGNAFNRKFNI